MSRKRKAKDLPKRRRSRTPAISRAIPATKGGTAEMQAARQAASQQAFLEQFRAAGTITSASLATGIDRRTHYGWLESDAEYAAAFKVVEVEAIDVLETEARRRALMGIEKPIYYKGRKIDTVKEYSDGLLMFLLNGRRSDVFKYRHEHTGKGGGPIAHTHTVVPLHELSDAELKLAEKLAARIDAGMAKALPAESAHAS